MTRKWLPILRGAQRARTLTIAGCSAVEGSQSLFRVPPCGLSRDSTQEGRTASGGKTEFEYGSDEACRRLLPKPRPGGFSRGNLIGWRRADRYGSVETLSVHDLYEFSKEVGRGGFGTVHMATHRRTGEAVAIKTLPKEKVSDMEALQHEVEFLRVADHPNVIRCYEAFEDTNQVHLIMELCTGGALSAHIKAVHDCHGPGFSESDLARIMGQLLRSLAYCHAHSIVHRDLKPSNFIFGCGVPKGNSVIPVACSSNADAALKLVDFGVSGVVRTDSPAKRWLTRRAGTDGYMAPEILQGQLYGPSADLFSLGAVLHTMIAGRAPRWDAQRKGYKFPGRVRWHSLSPAGQAFLEHLLLKDPAARPLASEAMRDPWLRDQGVFQPEDVSRLHAACLSNICQFTRRSKLQRSIMYSIVAFAPLHNHSMEQMRTAFLAATDGGTGGITMKEFAKVARDRGELVEGQRVPVDTLFTTVNCSQSGQISYSEWLAAAAPQAWYDQNKYVRRAFDTLDVRRNGYIDAEDLCQVLPGVHHADEIDKEIRCINPSGNGRLFFEDFCEISRSWNVDGRQPDGHARASAVDMVAAE